MLDMVRSMMSKLDLPLSFWGYALETTAFTLNRVPSKSVDKTLHEMWTGKSPSLSYLKIWGCEAFVNRLMSDKLTPKSHKWIFLGYPRESLGYSFYNPKRTKCLLLGTGFSLRKSFSVGRPVGGRSDSKKFEYHSGTARLVMRSYRSQSGNP